MDRNLAVEPGAAVAKGLPPARINLSLENTPLWGQVLPDDKTYLVTSGPPGGPLFLSVHPLSRRVDSDAALEALIRERYATERNFNFGPPGEIELRGDRHRARLFFTGQMAAASAVVALVILPPAENASAPGLLVIFGHGGSPDFIDDCLAVASCEYLAPALESLEWDLAIAPGSYTVPSSATPAASASEEQAEEEEIEEEDEEEVEEEEGEREIVDSHAPVPMQNFTAGAMENFLDEIQTTMKDCGLWHATMPTSEAYASMSELQMQMWSLQSTLQSFGMSLKAMAQRDPNMPMQGAMGMFDSFKPLLAGNAQAKPLADLFERGPKS